MSTRRANATHQRRLWRERPHSLLRPNGSDQGSGSILGVAILGAVIVVISLVFPFQIVLAAKQRIASAADASALAAADIAAGMLSGFPCPAASQVAGEHGATVTHCRIEGTTVTVRTSTIVLGFQIAAQATAGQPKMRSGG